MSEQQIQAIINTSLLTTLYSRHIGKEKYVMAFDDVIVQFDFCLN